MWEPGRAQADFGEADLYVSGVRTRLSFFVLSFPYSNVVEPDLGHAGALGGVVRKPLQALLALI